MTIPRSSAALHRWLALIIGLQLLLWIASGAFFAIVPIERVRSEHRVPQRQPQALDPAAAAALPAILASLPAPPLRLVLEQRHDGAVAIAEFATGRPALFDATTGRRLSPIGATDAQQIALDYVGGGASVRQVTRVTVAGPEYRGLLPAWRVRLGDDEGLALYVAEDTAAVTARRSDLWRLYDALWALHIMDWRNHEDFNNGLLVASSLAALVVAFSGIVLLPFRFRLPRRRRAVGPAPAAGPGA